MLFTIFLLCLTGIPGFIQCKQLHEYMTPDEVMSVFNTPHHLVPEYEVVPVRHRSRGQGHDEVMMEAFSEDVKLYLYPKDSQLVCVNTPVWTVQSDLKAPEGLRYDQIPGAMKSLGAPVQDVRGRSALLLSYANNGRIHMDGILKNSYIIKSLPQRVLDEVAYGGENLYEPHHINNEPDDDDFAYTHHHVVYKMPPSKEDQYNNIDFMIRDPPKQDRTQYNVPDTVHLEVLVTMDYQLFELNGKDIEKAVKYLVSFWNGVDLRYRLLSNPKIRLRIAGLIIATDKNATPYLEKHIVDMSSVDADLALKDMADYYYRENRFIQENPVYDIAVCMTYYDICNFDPDDKSANRYCDPQTLGYAYVAGACNRNHTTKTSEATSIVEDNGGYGGIIPVAHEIGHLIGASHDGSKNAPDCGAFDGFIMSSGLMMSENGFEWSQCSINSFYKFLNQTRANCLYNKPAVCEPPQITLPGKLKTLDEQCQKAMKTENTKCCNKNTTEVCIRLMCQYPEFGPDFCTTSAPAAEGSPCENGKICLNGKCVVEGPVTKEQEKKMSLKQRKFLPKFRKQDIRLIRNKMRKISNKIRNRQD